MKENHSEEKSIGTNDPCCDEQFIQRSAIWIFLFLAFVLITAIILGYVLAPTIIRILWLVISSTLLIVVLPILIFLGSRIKEFINEKNENNKSHHSDHNLYSNPGNRVYEE